MRIAPAAGSHAVRSPRTRSASCCASRGFTPSASGFTLHGRRTPRRRPPSRVRDYEAMAAQKVQELLTYLVEGLVDDPDEVSVEQFEEDDGTVVLELAVAAEDYGKVIGRGGRTAQALRTVVRASAASAQRRVLLDIVD